MKAQFLYPQYQSCFLLVFTEPLSLLWPLVKCHPENADYMMLLVVLSVFPCFSLPQFPKIKHKEKKKKEKQRARRSAYQVRKNYFKN